MSRFQTALAAASMGLLAAACTTPETEKVEQIENEASVEWPADADNPNCMQCPVTGQVEWLGPGDANYDPEFPSPKADSN